MAINQILKQGQMVDGGVVNYDTSTGAKLAPGQVTNSIPVGDIINPVKPINLNGTVVQPTDTGTSLVAGATASNNQFNNDYNRYLELNKTQPNTELSDLIASLGVNPREGMGQAQIQAEEQLGIPKLTQEQADIEAEKARKIAEYNKINTDYEAGAMAKGITTNVLLGRQALVNRQAAADIGLLEARSLGLQGKITAAQNAANRAIDLLYADKEARYQSKLNQYNAIKDQLSGEEAKRGKALEYALKKEGESLAEQKQTEKDIQGVALTLAKNGQDPNIIKGATSVMDAINLAGSKLQDPKSKLELEKLRADILKTQRETALLGQPTAKEKKAEADALKTKQGQQLVLQDKLSLIQTIKDSPGLIQRVGSNFLTRTPSTFMGAVGKTASIVGIPGTIADIYQELTGKGQAFAGAVHRLASTEFINNLINAKSQGATFGALNMQEGEALRAAATQLNDWEIKDKNGLGTGRWNIDEKTFKDELTRLETLTRKALGRDIFTNDESQILDNVYGSDDTVLTPGQFFNQ